ncbi:cytochrome P450 [Streptomyces sp. NPDC020707]|uniref:Cytochrome P450 n=1 Tax=Streptomyces ortus TaxID=2867268 RepID=A0ABT3VFX6_9ACTN|nr:MULTISPECIES: cytochrome P450 [Streptomyces]MCX4238852.1 cytochrome P450 [Streptomyces ortus]
MANSSTIFLPATYARHVPHELFRHLRDTQPVSWVPEPAVGDWAAGPGYWAVVRHADTKTVLQDHETYSSHLGGAQLRDPDSAEDLAFLRSMIVNQDPPSHTRLRRSVATAFSPRAVRELEEAIEGRAAHLIDSVIETGRTDFAHLVADLPVWTLAHVLGMPEQDRPLIYDWADRVIGYQDPEYAEGAPVDPDTLTDMGRASFALREGRRTRPDGTRANPRAREALADIFAYAHSLADAPRTGSLMACLLDGGLNREEFELMFFGLVLAGTVTLRASAPGGLHSLLTHPREYEKLRAHPELIDTAVEEMLRFWSPGIMFRRTCARDTVLAGQVMRKGDKVGVYLISANRDERAFDRADRFDITRSPNDHISFGYGPHYCSGAHIARMELRAIIRQTVSRLPGLEMAGPPARMESNFVNGLKRFPLQWRTDTTA